jgi:hypothetical protein
VKIKFVAKKHEIGLFKVDRLETRSFLAVALLQEMNF